MESVVAVLVGVLFAGSVYLMLSRNLVRFVFGLVLIGNAANLAIFASGRLTRAEPPLIPDGLEAPVADVANALPQALILTSIVISFAVSSFLLTLIVLTGRQVRTLNIDELAGE